MPTIEETNAANARPVRTDADALAGLTVAAENAKAAREAARAAREAAKTAAKTAADAAAAAREARASAPKPKTARDAVHEIDAAILIAAGEAATRIAVGYPIELRPEILALVSNQLHHLASPKLGGWPAETGLPVPNRSEWQ